MVSIDALVLFLGTTFVVVLSPGPAVIAVSTEAVSSGVRRSILVGVGLRSPTPSTSFCLQPASAP